MHQTSQGEGYDERSITSTMWSYHEIWLFLAFLFTLLVHFNPCGLRTSNLISTGRMKVFQMTLASKAPGAKIITPLKTYTLKSCNNKDMLVLRMSITLT